MSLVLLPTDGCFVYDAWNISSLAFAFPLRGLCSSPSLGEVTCTKRFRFFLAFSCNIFQNNFFSLSDWLQVLHTYVLCMIVYYFAPVPDETFGIKSFLFCILCTTIAINETEVLRVPRPYETFCNFKNEKYKCKAAFTWANKTCYICANSSGVTSYGSRIWAIKGGFICSCVQGLNDDNSSKSINRYIFESLELQNSRSGRLGILIVLPL